MDSLLVSVTSPVLVRLPTQLLYALSFLLGQVRKGMSLTDSYGVSLEFNGRVVLLIGATLSVAWHVGAVADQVPAASTAAQLVPEPTTAKRDGAAVHGAEVEDGTHAAELTFAINHRRGE